MVSAGDGFAAAARLFTKLSSGSGATGGAMGGRGRSGAAALALAAGLGAALCRRSWPERDQRRDPRGRTLHWYGGALLAALPERALLLSHTDLDWGPARYLRLCEGARPDVTHLSVQLLPYPWFERQKALYPNVTFPALFPGVSTHKSDLANGRLIEEFVAANWAAFGAGAAGGGGIFLDLQAVEESDHGRPHRSRG
jgi:hypothetical protein